MRIRRPAWMAIVTLGVIAGCHVREEDMTDKPRATLTGGKNPFNCVAVAPDGKLVAGGNQDGSITLWDPATGAAKATLLGHKFVSAVAFSPDGRTLASGGCDHTARLWDVAAARQIAVFDGPEQWVNSLAFTPDGKYLATATVSPRGVVRLWDLTTHRGRILVRQSDLKEFDERTRTIDHILFTPDGRTLAVSVRAGVFLWDMGTESVRASLPAGPGSRLAVSPDGKTIATTSNKIQLRDPETGRIRSEADGKDDSGPIMSFTFTPDSKGLVLGHSLGAPFRSTVRLWDIAADRETGRFVTSMDSLRSIAIFPDGKTLATASDDGCVKLWDIPPNPR